MGPRSARALAVIVMAVTFAACSGGDGSGSPGGASEEPGTSTAPSAAAPSEAAPSAAAPSSGSGGGSAEPGTITISVDGKTGTTDISECTGSNGSLTVTAGTGDDVAVLMFQGDATPIISGTIDGIDFALGTDAKAELDGNSGTFSGADAGTGQAVTGSFACE